ncbi:hypothetical protein BKA70DRAFT_1560126 [Coprinopsis sp. MPI-PUGE-AT-0042]|nr:hypothetical protein BKA70DRAFT_1560126 [Coprinopsis sp. MPI-PUGE-AT-0042]
MKAPWSAINGSNRQWESGVHSTRRLVASCSLWFKGIGVHVRGTIPSGSDSQTFTYTVDDLPEVRVSNPQGSSNNYSVDFLRDPAPFQVDFFEYWPGENDPTPAPIYSRITTTPSSTALSPASEEPDSGRGLSTGAIAGISVGAAVLLIALSIAPLHLPKTAETGNQAKNRSPMARHRRLIQSTACYTLRCGKSSLDNH